MTADGRRRFPWRRFGIALAVILLIAAAPVISVIIAGAVADANGCTLHEGFTNPCVINGRDWGETLYAMGVMGWFMLVTIPFGVVALGIWTVLLVTALVVHRKRRPA